MSWFRKWPRKLLSFPIWCYSVYIGIGYWLAGALHYNIWKESKNVETIFTNFNMIVYRPSTIRALIYFFITGVIVAAIFHLLFHKIRKDAGMVELVFWGTATSIVFAWVPWLYASSVANTIFLFLFGMTSLTGFGLGYRLLNYRKLQKEQNPDSWKMLVNAIKACAAVVAILLGAIATSTLLPWRNSNIEGYELLRYSLLCAYIIFGMIVFILMPLLTKSLDEDPIENVDLEPPGPI